MKYTNNQIREAIEQTIHSERDRRILLRRYIDGICFEPLAEEVDMSVRQVKRIVLKHQGTVFDYVQKLAQ